MSLADTVKSRTRQLSGLNAEIIGINYMASQCYPEHISYTCDFNGYSTNGVRDVFATQEEAQAALEAKFGTNYPSQAIN